jgi:hypothetical protein
MFGTKIRNTFLSTAAAGAVALLAGTGSANAVVLDGWNLNLSSEAGIAGAADLTNIDHIVLTGISTVLQNVVNGVALGQTFSDSGYFVMAIYLKEGTAIPTVVDAGAASDSLVFQFTGLTGTLNLDGTITFNPGVGSISLFIDTDGDANLDGGETTLATFKLVSPSGGSDLDFFGGAGTNATVDVTLEQLTSIDPSLFTDQFGNDIAFNTVLHLGNVDALLDPNFVPNPDNSALVCTDPLDPLTCSGVSTIHTQNGGQYNITALPEPATLGMMGAGLFALGAATRRRRNR